MNMRGLYKCPAFSRKDEDYENWRLLVDDWIDMEEEERKYPVLELQRSIQGKTMSMVSWLDRKELKENGGVKRILHTLEKHKRGECI